MLVFWDVDTANDFMNEDGALPVPNARQIVPQLKKITKYGEKSGTPMLGSVDCHFEKELDFPLHCMVGTEGQKKIPETLIRNHTFIRSKVGQFGRYIDYGWDEVQIEIANYQQIIFEKQHIDVFTNRNVMKFLDKMRVSKAVVYGVATEYCVKEAVLGFLKLGIKVQVVSDAIKGINENDIDKAIKQMKEKGAVFTTTSKIINMI